MTCMISWSGAAGARLSPYVPCLNLAARRRRRLVDFFVVGCANCLVACWQRRTGFGRRRLVGGGLVRVDSWKFLEKLGRVLLLQPPFMLFQWWSLIGHNNKVSYWLRGTSQSQGLLFKPIRCLHLDCGPISCE